MMSNLVYIFAICLSTSIPQMVANNATESTPIPSLALNSTEEDFGFLDALQLVDAPVVDPYQPYERADSNDDFVQPNVTVNHESVAVRKCVPLSTCYKDSDCGAGPRGKSRCVGIFVGKCDCSACVSGLPCTSEATCGGLQNSCNNTMKICDCIKAHKANGFANFGQALLKLCNHQDCDEDSDTCFGLPCRRGRCVCL